MPCLCCRSPYAGPEQTSPDDPGWQRLPAPPAWLDPVKVVRCADCGATLAAVWDRRDGQGWMFSLLPEQAMPLLAHGDDPGRLAQALYAAPDEAWLARLRQEHAPLPAAALVAALAAHLPEPATGSQIEAVARLLLQLDAGTPGLPELLLVVARAAGRCDCRRGVTRKAVIFTVQQVCNDPRFARLAPGIAAEVAALCEQGRQPR